MRVWDIFKISRKTFLNPKQWADYTAWKSYNNTIIGILKDLLTLQPGHRTETFSAAMQRLGVSDSELPNIMQRYRWYSVLFLVSGFLLLLFSFYLLFHHGTFHGWLLATSAAIISFGYAFRFDFWVFQMERRQLGGSFVEWKQARWPLKG